MSLMFSGKTLDECLEKASKELGTPKEKLKYKIIKEKAGFLIKKIQIKVDNVEEYNEENIKLDNKNIDPLKNKENELDGIEDSNEKKFGIRVENGKIIVNENPLKDENITIRPCEGIILRINGMVCENDNYRVTESDKIEYETSKSESSRNATLSVSDDRMEASINIKYIPEYEYTLKDTNTYKNLSLRLKRKTGKYPPKYTVMDIKEILKKAKITSGIIEENIIDACDGTFNENVLIAKGQKIIEDIPSQAKIFFDTEKKNLVSDDSMEKVDYRNVYSITGVEEGQVLAEILPGKEGKDGFDIYGKVLKRNKLRNNSIRAGKGCKLVGNKIISTRKGRPSSKNKVLSVNNIYEIKDVDINNGNINFVGDVQINGSVLDGMEVKAGNSITVQHNVEGAKLIASGEINIYGNAINATILAGAYDIDKKRYMEMLELYEENFNNLINGLEKLMIAEPRRRVGELVSLLIDNRYKEIPKLSLNIITYNINQGIQSSELLDGIRNKILGLNSSNIKSIDELYEIKDIIENEIGFFNDNMIIPLNSNIGYCQNSIVKATGNIVITGKGQYISKFTALKDIEFLRDKAVARGGSLCAGGNIKLKTVGSNGGVITRLEVPESGIITADIAYQNTIFCFGKRHKMLDVASRNVKAYMKKDGEIVIEKFVL